jgi:hypothetical protein
MNHPPYTGHPPHGYPPHGRPPQGYPPPQGGFVHRQFAAGMAGEAATVGFVARHAKLFLIVLLVLALVGAAFAALILVLIKKAEDLPPAPAPSAVATVVRQLPA